MSRVEEIADRNFVSNQYRNATNLNARIHLHQEFSTNKYGWHCWLFDQLKLMPQSRILELGCGAGNLWFENLDRLQAGLEIVLSDFSFGMLDQAQRNLESSQPSFHYYVIDAQSIPFGNRSFDVVIANHVLYHLPDRAAALLEIQRVLKPDGRFYASTIGRHHLKELSDLIARFDPRLSSWGKLPADSFSLENGSAQLAAYFSNVTLYRYPDSFIVTDARALIDYILSGRIRLTPDQQLNLAKSVEQVLKLNDGKFYITKDSGVFALSGICNP